MSIQDRTVEFLENVKAIKRNTFLTDLHKEKINFHFKLSSVKPDSTSIEVKDETDYNYIVKYIISEIDNPNFIFESADYDSSKKYLFLYV